MNPQPRGGLQQRGGGKVRAEPNNEGAELGWG